ncbi:MAG: acetyltransferase [Mariprofundaceae bacterium]|nr:acetyltransferase [Mariprofundaceae bacterium]
MTYFDVFNGDADGLCALHQLRLAEPLNSTLITGVKRDIALLQRVQANKGDVITVLDVSLDKNRAALRQNLELGATIRYFDHHFAGDIPRHEHLEAFINTHADVCTSLLVNDYLQGAYVAWAVVAAFGDNLYEAARAAATPLNLSAEQLQQLEHLGTLLNYNGYGESLDDLYFHPQELYLTLKPFSNPFDFIAQTAAFQVLSQGFASDIEKAKALDIQSNNADTAVIMLPQEAWSRRVSGVYANDLARQYPHRAHAMISHIENGHYRISVRAPLQRKEGADILCMQFPTGGGRKAAAGINDLPPHLLEDFIQAFQQQYSQ